MDKRLIVIIALAATGVILYGSPTIFPALNAPVSTDTQTEASFLSLPKFSLPGLQVLPADAGVVSTAAWDTFQQYLTLAKAHDLPGLSSISYQLSPTCMSLLTQSTIAKNNDCYALMDSVALFGENLNKDMFNHIIYDDQQVILYTDGSLITYIYFTRSGADFKVLGLKFCDESNAPGSCSENISKTDSNHNGWWNSTESLFR